jgi:hypothetical protein
MNDVISIIVSKYIHYMVYYPDISNILMMRVVNKYSRKMIDFAILNYFELIFKLEEGKSYIDFYSKYINLYMILCINSKLYNAYQTKIMIYNAIYVIVTRYKIIYKMINESEDYKLIIDKNIHYEDIYNNCHNIKLYFRDIEKFKKYIKFSLRMNKP